MDPRTSCLSPTAPRATISALLIMMFFLATVPSTEAAPLASLPSISSPTGILMAVLSVTVVLSLIAGLVFMAKKWDKVKKFFKITKRAKKENWMEAEEIEQPRRESYLRQIDHFAMSLPVLVTTKPTEDQKAEISLQFCVFLSKWDSHSLEDKEQFIVEMAKAFPVAVTPDMAMDALQIMLSQEVNADLWMRMLRFVMLIERELFYTPKKAKSNSNSYKEESSTNDDLTHKRFQSFLVYKAELILSNYGDVARPNESGEAGFMRFIAYLFGFVGKDRRILELMEGTWKEQGFDQTDASRAMVWGFRRWMDYPRRRDGIAVSARYGQWHKDYNHCSRPTTINSNGNHHTFFKLMQELRGTNPVERPDEGSRAQHLLFALGCGSEPDWTVGPLAYMSDTSYPVAQHFEGADYLWLMMGRDLAMGTAWQWMCGEGLSEHDRMCDRFGQDSKMYEDVVDTVMKYAQDSRVNDGSTLMNFADKYSSGVAKKMECAERRAWFERYKREKEAIHKELDKWLIKNTPRYADNYPRDPTGAVEFYEGLARDGNRL